MQARKADTTPPVNQAAFEEMNSEIRKLKEKEPALLKKHLEVFNDAVIAIIITVMVLEVPLPNENIASYYTFLQSVLVFLISFFIVANFWYDLHQIYSLLKKATRKILIINFIFLFTLSLIPLLTKWIMQNPSSLAVINYGVAYFIINFVRLVMYNYAFQDYFSQSNLFSVTPIA
ncbi:putative membrane protein [Enterococcus sp. PF1-24]|uniref:TMEM175 family protein n=1 Tax=unclassified Enterococcus TaxID=2608891 RepID=UPI0024768A25|nr:MULTISPECIES: TMEM175 family protein [unclassified Enterococcus]MDH6364860.1 putative membrane protein [Enterococcus sp. PFB1-1]MDH6401916.1 putative membrane protein [Enterococcus sp. PF1-24]